MRIGAARVTFGAQTEGLIGNQLVAGETVVKFHHIDIRGLEACLSRLADGKTCR